MRTETFGVAGLVPGWDFREFRLNANGGAIEMPVAQSFSVSTFGTTAHPKSVPCAANGPNAAQTCFKLSPVLGGIFLPHRKIVLENYLNTPVVAIATRRLRGMTELRAVLAPYGDGDSRHWTRPSPRVPDSVPDR